MSASNIQTLNRTYRHQDEVTDVLSFVAPNREEAGDIAICPSYVRASCRDQKQFREEILRLITHGALHLFGYDHQTRNERQRMFSIQEACVKKVV